MNLTIVSNATCADKILLRFSRHALKGGQLEYKFDVFVSVVIFVFECVLLLVMSTDCSYLMP